jgi:hypothetical protein
MTLPNFLIIGAAKGGTTSLYHYLAQHPDVYLSPIKETNYYCGEENLNDGAPAIRDSTAYAALFSRVSGQRAIGEASPKYLNSASAPERIHQDLPGVRLIASLRNPADRAYSSYLGRMRDGHVTRSVEDALQPGEYSFETSFYFPRLQRYFRRFARQQLKIILFDDLIAQPRQTLRDLCTFLDIDPDVPLDTAEQHNPARTPRLPALNRLLARGLHQIRPMVPQALLWKGYGVRLRAPLLRRASPIPPRLRERLLDLYRADIRATGELIGRDLSHWLA